MKKNAIRNHEFGWASISFKERPVVRPAGNGRKEDEAFVSFEKPN